MTDSFLAVLEGPYRFGFEALSTEVSTRFPDAAFFPPRTIQRQDENGHLMLDIKLLGDDEGGVGLEGDDELAAEFVAWLTERPGFPADGSVVFAGWAPEPFPLRPNMTAGELLDL